MPPVTAEAPAAILPISVGAEADARGGPMRLRDALRQPYDGMDDGSQPYRLSVEQRQRLREQLRDQPLHESRLKP